MGECDNLDRFGEFQRVDINTAIVSHAKPPQGGTGAAAEFLPRNQIRVMLEFGDDDLIARSHRTIEPVIAEGVGHQVQRFGRVLGEHDLAVVDTHEPGNRSARALVGVRRFLRQLMCAAVHGRVALGEETVFGVEHLHRALRGGPGIQIRQRFTTAHRPTQDREIIPDRGDVERHSGRHGQAPTAWVKRT
ncbi:Uncharacterised protein [Mycobacteroides abscessus subsp. abscessus]|nr:Uncharacterised protein [Mycobacteroides abscessus subsp. abscessus]